MVPYNRPAISVTRVDGIEVASFVTGELNADPDTVRSFGDEWNRFASFTEEHNQRSRESGLRSRDARDGQREHDRARPRLRDGRWSNTFRLASVHRSRRPWRGRASRRSVYRVLPERTDHPGRIRRPALREGAPSISCSAWASSTTSLTRKAAIREAASMLKEKAWLLLYIYYSLDNRSRMYRLLFRASDLLRRLISRLPRRPKFFVCEGSPSPRTARSWCRAALEGRRRRMEARAAVVLRGQALESVPERCARPFWNASGETVFTRGDSSDAAGRGHEGDTLLGSPALLARGGEK